MNAGGSPITIEVPRLFSGIEPAAGEFALDPADFIVEERLAYEPSGDGEHVYLWIEKSETTTLDAIRVLAHFLDRPTHAFGMAGFKDAHAVTRQWLSIDRVDPARLSGWTINGVRVLRAVPHRHKLRPGHIDSNYFIIQIRNVPNDSAARAEMLFQRLCAAGLPNAYGIQRFGHDNMTLGAGLALIHHQFDLFRSITGRDAEAVPRRLRSLMISAVQSEVFNRVLTRRMPDLQTIEVGDIAYLHKNGAAFLVTDSIVEQPRSSRFEISPSGPLPGTRLLEAAGRPGRIENEVFLECHISYADFEHLPLQHEARGARRPLRVPIAEPDFEHCDNVVRLSFGLPSGSYATRVVEELFGREILIAARRRAVAGSPREDPSTG